MGLLLLLGGIITCIILLRQKRVFSPQAFRRIYLATAVAFLLTIVSVVLILNNIYAPDPNWNNLPLIVLLSLVLILAGMYAHKTGLPGFLSCSFFGVYLLELCVPIIGVTNRSPVTDVVFPYYDVVYQDKEFSLYDKQILGPPVHFLFEQHTLYSKPILRTTSGDWNRIREIRFDNGVYLITGNDRITGRDTTISITDDRTLY